MADFFQQQDVPSCMSVDVINSCPADKQVLLEKNILCLAVLQTVLCGYETPWSPFRLSLAHPTTQFPRLITRRIRLQRHHHWSPSDASEDCLTWKPTRSFTKARTQAEPGVPSKDYGSLHHDEDVFFTWTAPMPSLSHLADPLFASGHSVCKKIKTVDTQQKGVAWCREILRLHR